MLSVAGQSPPFCPEPRLPGLTDPCTSGCGKAEGVLLPCVEGQRSIPRRLNSRHPVLCKWLPSFQGGWTLLSGAIMGSPGDGGGTGAAAVLPELKGRPGGCQGEEDLQPQLPPNLPWGAGAPLPRSAPARPDPPAGPLRHFTDPSPLHNHCPRTAITAHGPQMRLPSLHPPLRDVFLKFLPCPERNIRGAGEGGMGPSYCSLCLHARLNPPRQNGKASQQTPDHRPSRLSRVAGG